MSTRKSEATALEGYSRNRPNALQNLANGGVSQTPDRIGSKQLDSVHSSRVSSAGPPSRVSYGPDGDHNANTDGNHYELAAA